MHALRDPADWYWTRDPGEETRCAGHAWTGSRVPAPSSVVVVEVAASPEHPRAAGRVAMTLCCGIDVVIYRVNGLG